jgi:hypothetical protein
MEDLMSAIELEPLPGSMTARVFENRHVGIKRTLFFDIEMLVCPTVDRSRGAR